MERRRRLALKDPEAIRPRFGYDTANQAAVVDGRYVKCPMGTPGCKCYGCQHAGMVPGFSAKVQDRRTKKDLFAKFPKVG